MRKKILSEFAIGVVLLTAIMVASIFWMLNQKQALEDQYFLQSELVFNQKNVDAKSVAVEKKEENKTNVISGCQPHYYEGEAEVRGWLVSKSDSGKELNVQIKNEDIEKLPTTRADSLNANFVTVLIDPTDQIRKQLANSSKEAPVAITVHGYAQICQSSPMVSISQATIAFKKS